MRNRTRIKAPVVAGIAGGVGLLGAAPAVWAKVAGDGPEAGGQGTGDPVYPNLGTNDYRVSRYALDFTYKPDTKLVDAQVTVHAEARKELSDFSLDVVGLDVHGVQVDGRKADFELRDEKLAVTAPAAIAASKTFSIRVDYTADPRKLKAPHNGWVPAPDGFSTCPQPDLARTVFPCNDHPSNKADYTFRITAPDELTAVANGSRASVRKNGDGTSTSTYHSRDAIATELVQVSVGDFTEVPRQGPSRVRLRDVVPKARAEDLEPALSLTPRQLDWMEQRLGRFPFEAYGILPANTDDDDAFDFTGLETQTLTLYKPKFLLQEEKKIASHMIHELTHNWFGNLVTPASWTDLWVNEGHADYYGLVYRYERGWPSAPELPTFDSKMRDIYSHGDQWRQDSGPVASPNAENLFDDQRYTGGVLVLYALTQLVGEETFRRIEHTFIDRHRGGNASTKDYIAVAAEVSGRKDVSGFLHDWLYGNKTPRMPNHPDWTVDPPKPKGSSAKSATRSTDHSPKDRASATL